MALATRDGVHLEAQLGATPGATGGVVACHPHPLYGGDMHNPVVVRAVEVCAAGGMATLRFNFRGVGASTGTHDGGVGEERDAEAALAHLRRLVGPTAPVALIGYSFGAMVSARLAGRQETAPTLAGLALLAPPMALVGAEPFLALDRLPIPVLIVAGTRDSYCPADGLERLSRRLPLATVNLIEGADHFFLGKLFPLGEAVAGWARRLQARETTRGSSPG
ncbi:MAG TPA: alpha/beta fold hydrolase [Methylomirabilota bacterium]|nr:alpha/beta fold hydrolase [Methylomirabilota bacterium]